MLAKTLAFLIWAAVAAAAVYWGLHLAGAAPEAPPYAQPAPVPTVARSDLDRVLGAAPALPAPGTAAPSAGAASSEQGRFQLLGVIAPGTSGRGGWATLAVDGKPARTFAAGALVDGASVLQKVSARGVEIGPRGGAPVLTLQLAAPVAAATGRPGAVPLPAPVDGGPPPVAGGVPAPDALRRPGPSSR